MLILQIETIPTLHNYCQFEGTSLLIKENGSCHGEEQTTAARGNQVHGKIHLSRRRNLAKQ